MKFLGSKDNRQQGEKEAERQSQSSPEQDAKDELKLAKLEARAERKSKKEDVRAARREKRKDKFLFKAIEAVKRVLNNRFFGNMAVQTGIVAIALLLFIESWEYKWVFGGVQFLIRNPLAFLLNAFIIFATLTPVWLFRRRIFFCCLISTFWLLIGVVNGLVLAYRMTPFTTADMQIMDMGLELLPTYMTNLQIVMLIVGAIVVLVVYVLLFLFAPKHKKKVDYRKSVGGILLSALVLVGGWNLSVHTGVVSNYFRNLWDAYYDYGVPYCFLNTWLNKGIKKPADYSKATVEKLLPKSELDTMSSDEGKTSKDFPNIVFLQLESFIDPEQIKGLTYNETPTPYFDELKKDCSTGYLTVPVVGGGTANTELEVMSGISMKFFGPGEFPYKSLLQDNTCETMAYDTKELGYTAHAIHNHRASFYNRNTVFPNLGYDDFTSIEYMNYVSKTPKGFAKDDVLVDEIMGALESTKSKDYIYTISVQGHGEYPKTKTINNPAITVKGAKPDTFRYSMEYYLQQVHEMDADIQKLTEALSSFKEKTVLVLYGDHVPPLPLTASDLKSGTTFDTQYVIWSNYGLPKEDKNIAAYQLSAYLQQRIGMRQGTLTVYHQDNMGKKGYLAGLHMLQYDMLYGKKYIYGGKSPFKPTDMKMGFSPIKIKGIVEVAGQYYISGEGFTPYSKVSLGNKVLKTIFLGPTVLKLLDTVDPSDVPLMKVSQVESNNSILSTTE